MRPAGEDSAETSHIMLRLLDAVEQDRAQSQRRLASELGIALGLVNAYLKRCVKKGLVKVQEAPARRYAYYLTPQGFAEKSRLTLEYLSYSFTFFRQAKADCTELLRLARMRGVNRILFLGQSDLAEIAALCAIEQGLEVAGLVDASADKEQFLGAPVFEDIDAIDVAFDVVLITDIKNSRLTCANAVARFGADCVLVPDLMRGRMWEQNGVAER